MSRVSRFGGGFLLRRLPLERLALQILQFDRQVMNRVTGILGELVNLIVDREGLLTHPILQLAKVAQHRADLGFDVFDLGACEIGGTHRAHPFCWFLLVDLELAWLFREGRFSKEFTKPQPALAGAFLLGHILKRRWQKNERPDAY